MRKSSKFKVQSSKIQKKKLLPILLLLLLFYFLSINLRSSAFFGKQDRINIVSGAEKLAYFSLGLSDRVNYYIPFFPDLEVVVPGGYGHYRLGALNKLSKLEKEPDLYRKTYSLITSSMVDFYFFPSGSSKSIEILFGEEKGEFALPGFSLLFFGESNANFFDRLYIYLKLFGKTKTQFKTINTLNIDAGAKRKAFSINDFFEATQGLFYKRTYRKEQLSVQIIYAKDYLTAKALSQILEGEGIRVVDLTADNHKMLKKCEVIEEVSSFSQTARVVSQFFGCQLTVGKTEAYDIIFKLEEVEKKWAIE